MKLHAMGGVPRRHTLLVLLLGPLSYQAVAQSPESGTMRVNVELATVEVAVTNKESQHLSKLTKNDFILWLDGKQQQILTADEVRLGEGADKSRAAKVQLLLFDDSLTQVSQVPASREAAKTYITKHMNPGDLAAVVVHEATLRMIQNFTSDTSKVIEAIEKSKERVKGSQPGLATPGVEGSTPKVDPAPSAGNLPTESGPSNLSQTLNLLSSSMLRIKGRKAILVFANSSGNSFLPFE